MCKKKEFMSDRVVRALVLISPDHPDRSVLEDYKEGKLNSADQQAVEFHLTDCKACISLLVEVTVKGQLSKNSD
jgi:hypothetical protein